MSPARFLALCLVAGAELPPSPPASIPGELLCELDGITTNAEPDLYDILVAAGVSVYRENAHWLQLIRRADPNATLFVDVGVNKGYFIAEVFARWRPSAGLTPQTLFQAYVDASGACAGRTDECRPQLNGHDLCGHGDRCAPYARSVREEMAADAAAAPEPATPLRVIGFDASPAAAALWAIAAGPGRPFAALDVTVRSEAIYDGLGQAVRFDAANDLRESSGVVDAAAAAGDAAAAADGLRSVAATSLDAALLPALARDGARARDALVDLLKIDAEGAEPAILFGARALLRAQRVAALVLEVHHKGAWARATLGAVVRALDGDGFSCYLGGAALLVKLSGGCFVDALDVAKEAWRFDTHAASVNGANLYCAHRRHRPALVRLFDAHATVPFGAAWLARDARARNELPAGVRLAPAPNR